MEEDTEIAIVGIGCRFPGADDIRAFWRVLKNGENHVVDIPDKRWNIDSFYDADPSAPGKSYVKKAGLVTSLERWDNHFHGISDIEAQSIDPQQRLVLDCVHMALENGGITRKDMDGSLTGVYIGAMNDEFDGLALDDTGVANNYAVTGTQRSIISARVAYVYNLQGPALTIDTACSSSLVAINLGSQALKLGDCNLALCGGVNCLLDPNLFVALSKARMLSPTGQCQAFSANADGYARGEGCGIVILKRLKDAVRDRNEIWGTIKTATNQDGHMASPMTAPSEQQQTTLLEHVYSHSNTDQTCMQVIEAHGTGTPIGDPVEANALGKYFQVKDRQKPIFIGSVKTNIGHLESAAGVAGLIKVLLMMKHTTVVPSLMYSTVNENPKLNFTKHGLKVPTACQIWENNNDKGRMACVNSFGFGGTNAHAIVKEYMQTQCKGKQVAEHPTLVVLSAHVGQSLFENVTSLKTALEYEEVDIAALAFTTQFKRDHRKFRKAFPVRSKTELIEKLKRFTDKEPQARNNVTVNFVFCGVGNTWPGMCRQMMNNRIFSSTIGEIDCHLKTLAGWSVGDKFRAGFASNESTMTSHIAIFACQVGLDALWKAAGIQPTAVVGQSVGEVAAAYSAGYLDLKSAVKIIYHRSKFLAKVTTGKMVVVKNVDIHAVESIVTNRGGTLTIAVLNSQKSCTLAGNADEIEAACNFIRKEYTNGVIIHLNVQCAYHSEHVNDAAQLLKYEVNRLQIASNGLKSSFYSTVTGRFEDKDTVQSGRYWEKNVRMQVKFGETVKRSVDGKDCVIFLEIGPAPVLRAHLDSIVSQKEHHVVAIPSLTRNNEAESFVNSFGILYEYGLDPNWCAIFPTQETISPLPTYVFRDRICPIFRTSLKAITGSTVSKKRHLYMEKSVQDGEEKVVHVNISPAQTPFVFEHRVKKNIVVPGALYAETAFFIGENMLHLTEREVEISLEFISPLTLSENTAIALHGIVRDVSQTELEFVVKSGIVSKCKGRVKQILGPIHRVHNITEVDKIEIQICKDGAMYFSQKQIYEILGKFGFHYGPSFKILQSAVATNEECLVDIEIPDAVLKDVDKTVLHPCVLDGVIQSCFFGFNKETFVKSFLPAGIEAIHYYGKPERIMKIHTRKTHVTALETMYQVHFDMVVLNTNDDLLFHVRNFTTYVRLDGWKVPVELHYSLSHRPLTKKMSSQTQQKTLFILTDETNHTLIQRMKSAKCVSKVKLFSEMTSITVVADDVKENDVVVALFEAYKADRTDSCVIQAYEKIRENCWILTQLMRSLMEMGIQIPLAVTTQNAQLLPTESCNDLISIVGPEVWGFTRSAQMEFILKDVTLLDLQPSLDATMDTFMSYLCNRTKDCQEPKEIIIHDANILHVELNKLPKSTICPRFRVSTMVAKTCAETRNAVVFLPDNVISKDPYVGITAPAGKSKGVTRDSSEVKVQAVFQHPTSLYSHPSNDGALFGIEYTGIESGLQRTSFLQCKGSAVDHNDMNDAGKIPYAIVYPACIKPHMQVPRDCMVSTRDIPFYKPGLLVHALIYWEIAKHVPAKSACLVIAGENHNYVQLLKYMLKSVRRATVDDTDGDHVADVIIFLSRKSKVVKQIWHGKLVIALPSTLSPSQISLLADCRSSFVEVGFETTLSSKMYPMQLKDVAKWLKKNQEQLASQVYEQEAAPAQIQIAVGNEFVLQTKRFHHDIFDKSATYIITGGLTGLGWELAQLIIEMGARSIAILSRRHPSLTQTKDIAILSQEQNCRIVHIQADVGNLESVENAMHRIENDMGNVKGIFHCAGVLDSQVIIKLDISRLENVLKPKVLGALNLHYATRHIHLDYFVLTSSVTSVIGTPGQSNYGAANNFLDAFAIYLRQKGFACQSIRWGALDLGMVKDNNLEENMKRRGHRLMSIPEIQSCFRFQMMINSTGVIYSDLDWDIVAHDYANAQMQTLVHKIENCIEDNVTKRTSKDENKAENFTLDLDQLQTAERDVQVATMEGFVTDVAKRILTADASDIKGSSKLTDVGFDSMSSITFINITYDYTMCRIPFEIVSDSETTFSDIVEYLLAQLFGVKDQKQTLPDTKLL